MLSFVIIFITQFVCFRMDQAMEPIVLVHGGAGHIPNSRIEGKISGVQAAAKVGYKVLSRGGSALDAVEAAVKVMEDLEAFNAGYGSVLNLAGYVEMDALIMNGSNLNAGAVSVVQNVQYPISLARLVMERTPHVIFSAHGATEFAISQDVPQLPPGALVSPYAREALEHFKKYQDNRTEIGPGMEQSVGEVGTVGAVAIDSKGHLASATSTGGYNGKMVGRVSDTSQVGSGGYADDLVGAVSTTGHGESIAKTCLAHNIIKTMEAGKSASEATTECLKYMTNRLKNTAGAITLSKNGDIGINFTSHRMAWAYQKGNQLHFGIEHNQDDVLTVD